MIKNKELRKKSLEDLYQLRKELDFERVKASSKWGSDLRESKKLGIKGTAKKGEKTSLQRDLRRLYARIETIIKEKQREVR